MDNNYISNELIRHEIAENRRSSRFFKFITVLFFIILSIIAISYVLKKLGVIGKKLHRFDYNDDDFCSDDCCNCGEGYDEFDNIDFDDDDLVLDEEFDENNDFFKNTVDGVKEKATEVKDKIVEKVEELKKKTSKVEDNVKEAAEEVSEKIDDAAQDAADKVEDIAEENFEDIKDSAEEIGK